jgi:hypothetical protein
MKRSSLKIISGGQTGADRAALDVAIALGLDYGGAIPEGRKAEDGPLDLKYDKMTELNSTGYRIRTEKNVIDGDATLIFIIGKPDRGTALTISLANKYNKSFMVVDLMEKKDDEAIRLIKHWLVKIRSGVLNVAGSRESGARGIYSKVFNVLRVVMQDYVNN